MPEVIDQDKVDQQRARFARAEVIVITGADDPHSLHRDV
jgi:hypothetical protein